MKICVVDFETYWDSQHSLSKMSPIVYCMHEETELISCSILIAEGSTVTHRDVYFGEEDIRQAFDKIDWSECYVIGHNMSAFDSMLMRWRLGIKPKMWGCTLAMAKPIHTKSTGCSLAALVEHYDIGVKNNTVLLQTKGKKLKDFTAQELKDMRKYNMEDSEQCYELFKKLYRQTTKDELMLIDSTIRMLVDPQLEVDTDLLNNTLAEEEERKEQVLLEIMNLFDLKEAGMTKEEGIDAALKALSSAVKFGQLLKSRGVAVPTKVSPTTGKEIPALAKTDNEFQQLRKHPDPFISMAAEARLDAKSTLLTTRIKSFLDAAESRGGRLPIPLHYCGADTTWRWSGWAYNPQNLPRVPRDKQGNIIHKPSNALRMCLRAPKGHSVVVADSSGIELRVNHTLWQVDSSIELFRRDAAKADLYKSFAANSLYEIDESEVSKDQRQVGKIAQLGLGFGAAAKAFQKVAKIMGGIDLSLDECEWVVRTWRLTYSEIVEGWKACQRALTVILHGKEGAPIDPWGLTYPVEDGIKTPKGKIMYPHLRAVTDEETGRTSFKYGTGRREAYIHGAKVVENIVQHLARTVLADNILTVYRSLGIRPALTVHDELVYVVPNSKAEATLDRVQEIMRTPPEWWPELITWSEGDIAQSYGEAK